jgi:hypothetical protein
MNYAKDYCKWTYHYRKGKYFKIIVSDIPVLLLRASFWLCNQTEAGISIVIDFLKTSATIIPSYVTTATTRHTRVPPYWKARSY